MRGMILFCYCLSFSVWGQNWVATVISERSDYRYYNFDYKQIRGKSYFAGKDFSHASFIHTEATGRDFSGARMEKTVLRSGRFRGADFRDVVMREIDAQGADFEKVDFRGADLHGNFIHAIFMEAKFQGADLRWAKLPLGFLKGAVYDAHTKFPEGFDPEEHGMIYESRVDKFKFWIGGVLCPNGAGIFCDWAEPQKLGEQEKVLKKWVNQRDRNQEVFPQAEESLPTNPSVLQ